MNNEIAKFFNEAMAKFNMSPPADAEIKLSKAISKAQKEFGGRKIMILSEFDITSELYECFHLRKSTLSDLPLGELHRYVFIYASWDVELALPFVEKLFELGAIIFPVEDQSIKKNYGTFNKNCRDAYSEEYIRQNIEKFFKYSFNDTLGLMQAIDITKSVKGDIVEIGTYNGSSACFMLNYASKIRLSCDCYFYDIFTGFDYDEAVSSQDPTWKNTHASQGYEIVAQRLKKYEDPSLGLYVKVIKKNIISEELENEKIRLVHIDVDMYEAIYASLVRVAPRVSKGGVIILHDPSHTPWLIGARVAYEKFLKSKEGKGFISQFLDSGQFMLIKK